MCGLAGILGNLNRNASAQVSAMITAISHRGPDADAVMELPGAVLGHRRLTIIDLSDRGSQPMRGADGSWLVYNGEIYNYRELRTELADRYPFQSESDSEVVLAAWACWGEAMLDRLNGMFGLCIYNPESRRAFLARDRFGQKPLYLHEQEGRLAFASEVKALLALDVPARPNRAVWARYLAQASYDDTAETYFASISQLMPGEYANWDPERGLVRSRYFDIAAAVGQPAPTDPVAAARALLVDATSIHMRSDVPVAVALSGGLDSSALLASLGLAGTLSDAVRYFSVDFGSDLSERPWIEAAADHHGLRGEIRSYGPQEFRADVRPMMWHLEGPIGGLMNCALAPVMAAARNGGFKVIQDGTGLDEAFGGYRNHHDLYLAQLIARRDPAADAAVRDYARNWGVSEIVARAAAERAATELAGTGSRTAIDGTVPIRPECLKVTAAEAADLPPLTATGDPLKDALIDYLQVRKIPRNTRMKDRLSMAYGLELRLPFLDYRLVSMALSLPAERYFRGGYSKAILREALAGAMDDGVRLAPKRSIQAPQGDWLRAEPMRGYVQDLIDSDSFSARGYFDVDACRAGFARFCDGAFDNSFFVWQWINVEEWHRMFVDADPLARPEPLVSEIAVRPRVSPIRAAQ